MSAHDRLGGEVPTLRMAEHKARRVSRTDRCAVYVVRLWRHGESVYRVVPAGILGLGEWLESTWDSGERVA